MGNGKWVLGCCHSQKGPLVLEEGGELARAADQGMDEAKGAVEGLLEMVPAAEPAGGVDRA